MTLSDPAPGMRAFDSLRAEDEAEWLVEVFHQPENFGAMSMNRSLVVFGSSGTGKTAIRLSLEALCAPGGQKPTWLVVQWMPPIPFQGQSKSEIIQEVMHPIYDACAQAMLEYLSKYPRVYFQAKKWAQSSLRAFIACFLAQDYDFTISQLEDNCTGESWQLLNEELRKPFDGSLYAAQMPIPKIIAQFSTMVVQFQLKGIWMMIDGVERWLDFQHEEIEQSFDTFFSTLSIFENPAFAFKIMLPGELLPALSQCQVIRNQRVVVVKLDEDIRETPDYLKKIVEKHMVHATGVEDFSLSSLVKQPTRLQNWLELYADPTPRAWLELIQHLLRVYMAQAEPAPLPAAVLSDVLNPRTPKLRIDFDKQQLQVGRKTVRDIQPAAWKILMYLYENRARLCTRDEIYYLCYLEWKSIPKLGDPIYQSPTEWRGTIDTALYRLRLALEGRSEEDKEKNKDREKDKENTEGKDDLESEVEGKGKGKKTAKEPGEEDVLENPYLTTVRKKGIRLDNVE